MAIRSERVRDVIRLSNGDVELEASTAFGPRILHYAFDGGDNVFGFVDPARQGVETRLGTWHIYGGHRLWSAPEEPLRSYVPDNDPVHVEVDGGSLVLTPAAETETGIAKMLRLGLAEQGTSVRVEHRITNVGGGDLELAVWALSLMAVGGTALLPSPPFAPHPEALLPARRVVTWPYTFLDDPRFRFGPRFTRIEQSTSARSPQKLGVWDAHVGWVAYVLGSATFVKRFAPAASSATYADLGCNVEVFTDSAILELETLGPLVHLVPGASALHVETWELLRGVRLDDDDDALTAGLAAAFDDGDCEPWR